VGAISALHFLNDWKNHVKSGSLTGIFIHADSDELAEVGRNAGWDGNSKSLQCNLQNKTQNYLKPDH